jgi:hypothetical protein
MKCWNSAFNAQGSRITIVIVHVTAVKIYVAAVQALRRKKNGTKLSLPPKLVEKLVWVPVISFCKLFIPSYAFDALLCCNLLFLPPSRQTLSITLIRTRCIAIHSEISPCAKRIYYSLQNSCTATTMGRLQRQQTWYALT